jgi:hypothetical protein
MIEVDFINIEEIRKLGVRKGFASHEERRKYYPLLLNVSLQNTPEFPHDIIKFIHAPKSYGSDAIFQYIAPTSQIRYQIYVDVLRSLQEFDFNKDLKLVLQNYLNGLLNFFFARNQRLSYFQGFLDFIFYKCIGFGDIAIILLLLFGPKYALLLLERISIFLIPFYHDKSSATLFAFFNYSYFNILIYF